MRQKDQSSEVVSVPSRRRCGKKKKKKKREISREAKRKCKKGGEVVQ